MTVVGVLVLGVVPAQAAATGSAIAVDSTLDVVDFSGERRVADLPGADGRISLREAAIASTNTPGPNAISFDIPTSDPGFDGTGFTIGVEPATRDQGLILGDDGTTLDGMTQPGGYPITVQGGGPAEFEVGLTITSSGNTVRGLAWRLYDRGIQVSGAHNLLTGLSVHDGGGGVAVFGETGIESGLGDNAVTDSVIADNARSAVTLLRTPNNTVSGNTITGNGNTGVYLNDSDGADISANTITANGVGLHVPSFGDATTVSVTDNTIAANTGDGVMVDTAGVRISRNRIYDNGELGINLRWPREDEYGVNKNGKGGPPNFPDHLSATGGADGTVVEGRITDYDTAQSVTIELYASEQPDPSGHGEGRVFLSTASADRRGGFTTTLPGDMVGTYLSATATHADGTTSEFSETVPTQPDNGAKGNGKG
ncbi:MAG TPA: right-handed parallel beta-helix repeat-containing protein [Mycobacterium sp.]|nr:right-handed parallel beta-helix repeat-containing protein [Mycobacterium sp.]